MNTTADKVAGIAMGIIFMFLGIWVFSFPSDLGVVPQGAV